MPEPTKNSQEPAYGFQIALPGRPVETISVKPPEGASVGDWMPLILAAVGGLAQIISAWVSSQQQQAQWTDAEVEDFKNKIAAQFADPAWDPDKNS